ncbi:ATP binding cassette transmembrane transporter [Penaeus vannamei]|uniref:ATP binding cassette transmembrane transporter n=1 Tax=Penaeus vannamei TaxID=6689 RepID=A0A423SEM1_PENVA|nr:ATP binding cassette transmembrane transporter [Penaeus vannamei]
MDHQPLTPFRPSPQMTTTTPWDPLPPPQITTNPLTSPHPTSGLDSFMAQSVVNAMKRLTGLGKTVIATIHQPSSEVFAMFDRLLILAEGRVAFLGAVREAHKFFTRQGIREMELLRWLSLERPCPSNYSPGDHFIYSLAIRAGEEEQCRQFVHHVCDSYRQRGAGRPAADRAGVQPPSQGDALAHVKLPKSPYRALVGNQFLAMFRRTGLELVRDPLVSIIRLVQGW